MEEIKDVSQIEMMVRQKQADNFAAEHCADWIRIYGEVIEDVLGT